MTDATPLRSCRRRAHLTRYLFSAWLLQAAIRKSFKAEAEGRLEDALRAVDSDLAPAVAHQTLDALSHSGARDPWWWLAILGAAVLAPVAEELLYRGLLQQGLKAAGLKPRGAIAVTRRPPGLTMLTA